MWPTLDLLGINRFSLSSTKAFDYFGALGGLFPYVKPADLLLTSVMSELIARQWGVALSGMAKKYYRQGQCPQQATGKRVAWTSLSFFGIQRVLKPKLHASFEWDGVWNFLFSGSPGGIYIYIGLA